MYTIIFNLTDATDPECYGEFATLEEADAALAMILAKHPDDAEYLCTQELRPLFELDLGD